MIPKVIHYCWFGNTPLPESATKCIRSWKLLCPDYKIVQWNEQNYDVNRTPYVSEAYKKGKYAFVTDYVRLDVISKFGGVYLDTDVELVKNLDELLEFDAFFGMEEPGKVNTGLGFGAVKNEKTLSMLLLNYQSAHFILHSGKSNLKTCVEYALPTFQNQGLSNVDKVQKLSTGHVMVFSSEYFCPQSMETGKMNVTSKTYSIHHYEASWKKHTWYGKYVTRLKIRVHKSIDGLFGEGTYAKCKEKLF